VAHGGGKKSYQCPIKNGDVFDFLQTIRYTFCMYDLVIIGASAAGVTAAVYAKRQNLNFTLLAKDIGGEVATSGEVENYLGFVHTNGIELTEKFKEQLAYNHIEAQEVAIEKIKKCEGFFRLKGKKSSQDVTFEAKTIIIATGVHPREINISGEKEYRNKGVSYCTVCDGPIFKDKVVATIGGGNSALESLLMLSSIAKEVYSVNKNAEFKGEDVLIQKVKSSKNIHLITNAQTKKFLGDIFLSGLEYEKDGKIQDIEIQGAFIHIGMIPNTEFIDIVEKNQFGEIKVNALFQTTIPGIFAAGDVIDFPYRQINIAAGQGTAALLAVVDYLNKVKD